jgi:hypothetical protein
MSTALHPQTDGQSERTIKTLEDLLRACAMEFGGNWKDRIPLVEFTYNNSYQATIRMAPYEALYGIKCRTPVCWEEVGDQNLMGPEFVQDTSEKIRIIRDRMKAAQDRQKRYADRRRRPLEFNVGDKVYLKVSPWKHLLRFGMKGKLTPRYIRPYEIMKRIGPVAYQLALPQHLVKIYDVFHVSMLRKAEIDPTRVLPQIPIEVNEGLTMEVKPVRILNQIKKVLRNKEISLIKVLWRGSQMEEESWEREEEMRSKYQGLFLKSGKKFNFRYGILFLGGKKCNSRVNSCILIYKK